MGSSGSKAARTAAGSAVRKYPSRPPTSRPPPPPPSTAQPTAAPQTQASASKSEVIDLDGRDPQFASRLAELGPVKPAPTYSPSDRSSQQSPSSGSAGVSRDAQSFANSPAIITVTARKRIQDEVEQEKIDAGRKDFPGRGYIDIATVRKVLAYRDERGMRDEDIEKALGLRKGVVADLGRVGVVEVA